MATNDLNHNLVLLDILRSILILDFGSQYTQLIARRVREIGVYCELLSQITVSSELNGRWSPVIVTSVC